MQSLIDSLPSGIAGLIHPQLRANEADYWSTRDQLLASHGGQWVAFADGRIIAVAPSSLEIVHLAQASGMHPFVVRVGHEYEPTRMRRLSVTYDATYSGPALPALDVEVRNARGQTGKTFPGLIADTGADATALPWADCVALGLDPKNAVPVIMSGIGSASVTTLVFAAWVLLDGREYPCQLHADFTGSERLLGRDVLNAMDVLFRGPTGELILNP